MYSASGPRMEARSKGVFLTGGAKGIGRAILQGLLDKGAKVLFCDVNTDVGKSVELELQKKYGVDNVIFRRCDVTDAQQLQDTFQTAVSMFGAVEICVNNAGILDERVWEQMIAINTMGQIRGSQLALEHMRRDKGGRGGVIVNTVSLAGLVSTYNHPVYTASKHAMIGFTLSWAANPRLAEMGVRWGCLCPGPVDTDLVVLEDGKVLEHQACQEIINRYIIQPEVVVAAFMTLLEDGDSNGAIMTVSSAQGGRYRKRQLVDVDGVSNPMPSDVPFSASQRKA